MRGGQNAAVGAIEQRLMIVSVLAGENGEAGRAPAQEFERLLPLTTTILESDDIGMIGQPQHRLIAEIDAGPIGNVVEHDGVARAIGERTEVPLQALLRRPRVIWAGNQVSVDRPRRGSVQCVQQRACVAAGQAEADRKIPSPTDFVPHGEYKPFGFRWLQGETLARGGGENQSIDGKRRVMPHQPPQRRLVEFAIPERRDQRQPKALQASLKIGSSKVGSSKVRNSKVRNSKVSHGSISL